MNLNQHLSFYGLGLLAGAFMTATDYHYKKVNAMTKYNGLALVGALDLVQLLLGEGVESFNDDPGLITGYYTGYFLAKKLYENKLKKKELSDTVE